MCLQEYHGLILQKQTYIHDFNVCTKDYLMPIQCAVFTTKEKPNSRRRDDTLIQNISEYRIFLHGLISNIYYSKSRNLSEMLYICFDSCYFRSFSSTKLY